MATVAEITADLAAEHDDLDAIVAGLAPEDWARPTPSPRWDVADQIGHLRYFDLAATQAIVDPDAFTAGLEESLAQLSDAGTDFALVETRAMSPVELLVAWRDGRRQLLDAAATLSEDSRLVWYGPPMSGQSFLTARLMETWAHGQEVYDTLGVVRRNGDRIRNIVVLGVNTYGWTFKVHGQEAPEPKPHLVLTAPSGALWTHGEPSEHERIEGLAEEFCQVVTQTRNIADTSLRVVGPNAEAWMRQAQCFAGPPETPPAPGTRRTRDEPAKD